MSKSKMTLNPYFLLTDGKRNEEHKYLEYSSKMLEGRLPYVVLLLIRKYITHVLYKASDWKTNKSLFVVHWNKGGKAVQSEPINYSIILNKIKNDKIFNHHAFNLYYLAEPFLDVVTSAGLTSHLLTTEGQPQQRLSIENSSNFLGNSYPINSVIAREGFIIGAFMDDFFRRIIMHRDEIVQSSNECFTIEWFFKLRDIINDSIASLEISLNLIYNKAEFDCLPGWQFNKDELGLKYNRRFKDKLKWVHQISKKSFNIEKYQKSIFWLQELRNHLNHFDPPSFCLTIEQCAEVLNAIVDIGMVHVLMRESLGLRPSIALINLILQPQVLFKPENRFETRAEFNAAQEGYNTCRWPDNTL